MAIEGPLRELGIHDVFQLLDLSRKTGALRVSSELREDEGLVFFDGGRVVQATIRSTAMPTEVALLQAGRVTDDDIARARARQDLDGRDAHEGPAERPRQVALVGERDGDLDAVVVVHERARRQRRDEKGEPGRTHQKS